MRQFSLAPYGFRLGSVSALLWALGRLAGFLSSMAGSTGSPFGHPWGPRMAREGLPPSRSLSKASYCPSSQSCFFLSSGFSSSESAQPVDQQTEHRKLKKKIEKRKEGDGRRIEKNKDRVTGADFGSQFFFSEPISHPRPEATSERYICWPQPTAREKQTARLQIQQQSNMDRNIQPDRATWIEISSQTEQHGYKYPARSGSSSVLLSF